MQAEAGSIYVPLTSRLSSDTFGLVFLSIQPFGEQTSKLKKKIIPMQSSAGRCFITATPYVSPNSKADKEHFDKADQISGYRTEDMLNIPLRHRGETIGVLQLLNKEEAECFTESDIQLVEPFVRHLTTKVSEFVSTPENYEILGITPERDIEYATVMFCDLTKSSILFQEMNVSMAIQHINEYLERICDVGLSYGATVDKYKGDGVLLRFNVPRPVKDHPHIAVSAGLEIILTFEKLKSEWLTMGGPLAAIYTRIGISYGEVHQAIIGHPQYQYLTIFGYPVNIAVSLCEVGVRDRNVIIIDERMYNELSDKVIAKKIPKERLGKAISYIESAYELKGLN
ncbi:MAG: GAF domain-containing protein [Promethearchaeota archaeon]